LNEVKPNSGVRRRDLFRVAIAGAGAIAAGALISEQASAEPVVKMKYKRRSRYQAGSSEVRNFYRVNSYPAR
jgi:hypothetical protein